MLLIPTKFHTKVGFAELSDTSAGSRTETDPLHLHLQINNKWSSMCPGRGQEDGAHAFNKSQVPPVRVHAMLKVIERERASMLAAKVRGC